MTVQLTTWIPKMKIALIMLRMKLMIMRQTMINMMAIMRMMRMTK